MTTLGMILLVFAALGTTVCSIWYVVAAFRVETKWGLLVAFVPFAGIVFLFRYWNDAKRPFLSALGCSLALPLGAMMIFGGLIGGATEAIEQAQMQARLAEASAPVAVLPAPAAASQPAFAPVGAAEADPARATDSEPPAGQEFGQEPGAGPDEMIARMMQLGPRVSPGERSRSAEELAPLAIPVDRAADHIGESLRFVRTSGRSFTAELVSVDSRALTVRRDVSGGQVEYPILRDEVLELRAQP